MEEAVSWLSEEARAEGGAVSMAAIGGDEEGQDPQPEEYDMALLSELPLPASVKLALSSYGVDRVGDAPRALGWAARSRMALFAFLIVTGQASALFCVVLRSSGPPTRPTVRPTTDRGTDEKSRCWFSHKTRLRCRGCRSGLTAG